MISFNKNILFLCVALYLCPDDTIHAIISPIAVIGTQEENDLELFDQQNEKDKGLFHLLDRTQTTHGKEHLKTILKNPLTSITQLNQRQQTIATLINNPSLIAHLDAQLLIAKQYESTLQDFAHEQDAICKTTLDDFYFTNNRLKKQNENPTLLNILQAVHIGSMFAPIVEHAMLHWLLSDKMKEYLNIGCSHIHLPKDHVHSDKCNHSPADHAPNISSKKKLLYDAYNIAHWAIHIYGIKSLYDHIHQKLKISKTLQSHIIDANKCLESLQAMYVELKEVPQLSQNISLFPHLVTLFETPSPKTQALQELLTKRTFAEQASLMSNMGNTLAAYKMMRECADLNKALEALGEIDAYVSIAKLYIQHTDKQHRYTFANYAWQSTHPFIQAQDFWNPSIGSHYCCTNSIELGINNPNTLIITGPNMAGKSTNLKSVSLVVLLGQTFTIVPAEHVRFTPFTKIATFMRHHDDIQSGASLFMAELMKANVFADILQHLPSDQFSLVVFDELFKSTSFEKGQTTAYNLINYIGNFKNNLCMVSTHYPELTLLEKQDNTLFKNYHATVEKNKEGQPTFALKQGSSASSQSFDLLNNQEIRNVWNITE